jgi:tryptophan-rich sensory protein
MISKILPLTAAATAVTAVAGSVASAEVDSAWYARLRKPRIQPPGAVFGLVWTVLYTDIALTSAVALDRLPEHRRRGYTAALAANLLLNASWSWVFFRAHRIGPAIGVAAVLTVSSADLVRRTLAADRRAGWLLSPYAAWCAFATALTLAIQRRNR